MKELLTTVTKRGQVTVPAEVRRLLGIKPYDKVAFTNRFPGISRLEP